MSPSHRARQTPQARIIGCGTDVRGPAREIAPARPDAEARIITLHGRPQWLVTVVARLVSESTTHSEMARLILRIESLAEPERPPHITTVRARELRTLPEETLRALACAPAPRTRRHAALPRRGARR